MALEKYRQKRSFSKTPEPTGGKGKGEKLLFIIQKHAASHLHYDFRLEMSGVLKSWAVPKGPSNDPSVKRLAMMVEDHPYDYKDFEGNIPEGNYGAGTVIVWDEGVYEPLEKTSSKKEAEKLLLKQLSAGSLKFRLKGKKLRGEFALVKTHGRGENSWLLIKHRDEFASEEDITLKDRSVKSKKTLEEMASKPEKVYGKTKKPGKQVSEKKKTVIDEEVTNTQGPETKINLKSLPKIPFPETANPMLATLVDKTVEGEEWQYEIKWDGYRAIALCNGAKVSLISRNNKSFNAKFYPVTKALASGKYKAVFDGEVVVVKENGVSDFGALQNWNNEEDGELMYYVFDLLWLNGYDLKELPLTERRRLLKSVVPAEGIIKESVQFETTGAEFLEVASNMGMEGIIAKRKNSVYASGGRNNDWLKIKIHQRHEVVIGGFTQNDESRKTFSSLLVGVFEKGKLKYTGKIGTGFSDVQQKKMMSSFKPYVTKTSPFDEVIDVNKPTRFRSKPPHAEATWLRPALVCEVSYAEITSDGVMRHASFEGMREDKEAKDVVAEQAAKADKINVEKEERPEKKKEKAASSVRNKSVKKSVAQKSSSGEPLIKKNEESKEVQVNGHDLIFKHLSKKYWPEEGYTKRDLLNYYYAAAPFILPFLKDRPQSLNRFPNGIAGESFYHKDVTATAPEWVKQFPYHANGENKNFLVVGDAASILWMANLGAIEMNPWNSRIQKPDHPDWCIIDLDPTEKNSFDQVIETALVTKQVLDEMKVPGYVKTSGSTGIHIYIPLEGAYAYDECQLFGQVIATEVHQRMPDITSIERMTVKRKGKIYVDFLQNRPKATLAAPFSVRPKPGATVSMPLDWTELKKGLKMSRFTIRNSLAEMKNRVELFEPVLGKGINMKKVLDDLSNMQDS